MNSSTRFLSMKKAVSNTASISASDPVTFAGSGVRQWSFLGLPGNRGQLSSAA